MKNMKLSLLILLGIVFLVSCSNDDSVEENQLNKVWNLKNISGGFEGIDDSYEDGVIVWSFNQETLTIVNNGAAEERYTGLESGSYSFSIMEIDEVSYITINNNESGSIVVTDEALVINQGMSSTGGVLDAFILEFEE